MASELQTREELADRLYSEYGQPLEDDHAGEYVAVSPDGETVVGPSLLDVSERGLQKFGPGGFLFKIGDVAIGKWR